jgi:hypothetical protein
VSSIRKGWSDWVGRHELPAVLVLFTPLVGACLAVSIVQSSELTAGQRSALAGAWVLGILAASGLVARQIRRDGRLPDAEQRAINRERRFDKEVYYALGFGILAYAAVDALPGDFWNVALLSLVGGFFLALGTATVWSIIARPVR